MKTKVVETIDLHGASLKDALDLFFNLLNEARLRRKTHEVVFITGRGVIRNEYMKWAEDFDLEFHFFDEGALRIWFE